MIISVVSPHAVKTGTTVSSLLIGLNLSETHKKVFVGHANPTSKAFYQYLGLQEFQDKTSSPTQLVKLMKLGAVDPNEITDYCKNMNEFLDVFTNLSTNFSEEDMGVLLDNLLDLTTYEYMLFDIDCNYQSELSSKILEKSDVIILNISSSFLELDKFTEDKENILKAFNGKKIILVCSNYAPVACKPKEITKRMHVKTNCYLVRHNHWIEWGCNNGRLFDVYLNSKKKAPKLLEIYNDISKVTSVIKKAAIKKAKGGK